MSSSHTVFVCCVRLKDLPRMNLVNLHLLSGRTEKVIGLAEGCSVAYLSSACVSAVTMRS